MAGIFTNYMKDSLERHLLGITPYSMPTGLVVAIYTTDTGIVTNEPSGEANWVGYARAAITFDSDKVSSPVQFTGPPVETTVTHLGVLDSVADKILWAVPLTPAQVLSVNKPLYFAEGDIQMSLDTYA